MAWEVVLRTWVGLVVGGQTDPADFDLGMEVEPPALGHMHPSKEETPLVLELPTQLKSEVELKYK